MASVLFVGCTTPPTPEPEPEPTPTPTPIVSATPVLTAVNTIAGVLIVDPTSTSTQYMNIAQVGASILVTGTAPSESLVKIYLGDVAVGPAVAETSTAGVWTVAIAKSSLGDDGVKVLTAKVTEVGLAEGVASNAATFTLDTVRPSATTLAATANTAGAVATCVATVFGAGTVPVTTALSATTGVALVPGTWYVECLLASGVVNNVVITAPSGVQTTRSIVANQVLIDAIPGVTLTFAATFVKDDAATVLVVAAVTAVPERARVLFSEEITNASAIALANYTFTTAGVANVPTAVSYSAKYMYFSPMVTARLVLNATLGCAVNGVVDLAGNIQTTASALTCTVAAASLTSLAP